MPAGQGGPAGSWLFCRRLLRPARMAGVPTPLLSTPHTQLGSLQAHIHYLHGDSFGNDEQPEIYDMQCTTQPFGITATFKLHNKPPSALWEWAKVRAPRGGVGRGGRAASRPLRAPPSPRCPLPAPTKARRK